MGEQPQALSELQEYATKVKETEYLAEPREGNPTYEARLNDILLQLQSRVQQHRIALAKLRASNPSMSINEPSEDPRIRLRQLRALTATYKSLTLSEPYLPPPHAPLPALLALRKTQALIEQTKEAIAQTDKRLWKANAHLKEEEEDLKEAHVTRSALEKRLERLRLDWDEKSTKTADELANDMLNEQRRRKITYEKDTKILIRAFNKFVSEHLAGQLAAEELGGPVVGDILDIDDEMLEAGFNTQGNPIKIRPATQASEARRQRRKDEIWRSNGEENTKDRNEKELAGSEFRTLTEDLLNAVAEGENPYVGLKRDSAAARFLVRAKVAVFHPNDASKLRLVDFGAEFD